MIVSRSLADSSDDVYISLSRSLKGEIARLTRRTRTAARRLHSCLVVERCAAYTGDDLASRVILDPCNRNQ